MGKLILTGVVALGVAVPVWAAQAPDGRRGLRRLLVGLAVAHVAYWAAALLVYPRV